MIATYASVAAICAVSLLFGQAAMSICGRRQWSWLSPAVGLALLCVVSWATVRLPGEGTASALAVLVLAIAACIYLARARVEEAGAAFRVAVPVVLLVLLVTSLPFIAEGHFGILGTSFNPDMSQHLLATVRLENGHHSQLLQEGYPLGPHAVVVTLAAGLGIGLVQGFSGLMIAIGLLAALTALSALPDLSPPRRTIAALLVGLPYLAASYFAQGGFKETAQALFVLAFALGLLELSRPQKGERGAAPAGPLRAVPLALIAAGSVYVYSFPGLTWLAGTALLWAIFELIRRRRPVGKTLRSAARPALIALGVLAVLCAPEIGRMIDFSSFETFDPNGPGLGNLFGQISPFEALGLWPSGDFRLAPGDGSVPAFGYYAGIALGLCLLVWGLRWALRRGDTAIPAAFTAAVWAYVAARVGGTPYTAAKAAMMIAPPAMLLIIRPLVSLQPPEERPSSITAVIAPLAAALFVVGAGACSMLALANAPVGPSSYSPALTELRPVLASSATLVLAPEDFLSSDHGASYINWELRDGRVCIRPETEAGGPPPDGIGFVITNREFGNRPPFGDFHRRRVTGPYILWQRTGRVTGMSMCPLIAVRTARQGPPQ